MGISHAGNGKVSYFRLEGRLGRVDRRNLVQNISGGETPCKLHFLSVDQFLQEIEGKKIRHIWLETLDKQRKELAFASIAELKAHFQSQSRK